MLVLEQQVALMLYLLTPPVRQISGIVYIQQQHLYFINTNTNISTFLVYLICVVHFK